MMRSGLVAGVFFLLCCEAAKDDLISVHGDTIDDELLAVAEGDAKALAVAAGDGMPSGGAVSRSVWVPRSQWDEPLFGLEYVLQRLFATVQDSLPDSKVVGAAVRARWLPVRWRPPYVPADESPLNSNAPPGPSSLKPVRRSVLHFSGCSSVNLIADVTPAADGSLPQAPRRLAIGWPEKGRYIHWPGNVASWAVADWRLQSFDGCPKKQHKGTQHVSLYVDWWTTPVGNRTLDREWAITQGLKAPASVPALSETPASTIKRRQITGGDNKTFHLTLPASCPPNYNGLETPFLHFTLPSNPRNETMKAGAEGMILELGDGASWVGPPIATEDEQELVSRIGSPGARVVLAVVEASQIPSYSKAIERERAKLDTERPVRTYVADAGRAHILLPLFGLRRTDVPAVVVSVGGRYDPQLDVAKWVQSADDPSVAEVVARAGKDVERGEGLKKDHPPPANALAHSSWMKENRWLMRKGDLDRLCREPAAARAAHSRGGHPTMCLFLFDRQREDEPGSDSHDRILEKALEHVESKQANWGAAWEPVFVPTGVGSGGFGWPLGAKEAAIRLGLGHRSPPFIAGWEPEWESHGRWAAIYPPSPGYERHHWSADDVAKWLSELDEIAGQNPPPWWYTVITHPGFIVGALVVVCGIWIAVSSILRSQYDQKQKRQ